jgi:hypothetical protein
MKARARTLVLAAIIGVAPLAAIETPAFAAGNPQVCNGFARDYAKRNSRGPIAGGVTFGAIGGAIVGGILGGPPGAALGAAIGGGTGGAAGGVKRVTDYNTLYTQAYDACMAS